MTKVMGPVFVGIDVSARTLVVALERDHQPGRHGGNSSTRPSGTRD